MGVAFFEIQMAECSVINTIDMSILNRTTAFDLIRSLGDRIQNKDPAAMDGFYRYIDNVYLYTLVRDQSKYDIGLVCFLFAVVYFTAQRKPEIVGNVFHVLGTVYGFAKENVRNMERCRRFIMKKLKELGTTDKEVKALSSFIDISKQIGLALDFY